MLYIPVFERASLALVVFGGYAYPTCCDASALPAYLLFLYHYALRRAATARLPLFRAAAQLRNAHRC